MWWTCLLVSCNLRTEPALCFTEQIKPQHIVGEDSLDNDDEPLKGKLRYDESYVELSNKCLIVWQFLMIQWRVMCWNGFIFFSIFFFGWCWQLPLLASYSPIRTATVVSFKHLGYCDRCRLKVQCNQISVIQTVVCSKNDFKLFVRN